MKRILIYACLISITAAHISCDKKQEEAATQDTTAIEQLKTTSIEFTEPVFEFGNVNEGDTAKHEFTFKNTGSEPLYVKDARASCGCTTPAWTKDPIAPGGEGKILVQFNSNGRAGVFNKTVTVFANTEPEATIVTIKGHVIAKEKELSGPFQKDAH